MVIVKRESLEERYLTDDRRSKLYASLLSLSVAGRSLDRIGYGGRPLKFGLRNDNVQRIFQGVSRHFPFHILLIPTFISPK